MPLATLENEPRCIIHLPDAATDTITPSMREAARFLMELTMNIRRSDRSTSQSDPTWTALAHVMPRDGKDLLEGAPGAFVNAVGPAASATEFEHRLRELVAGLGFELVEIDDLELMSERRSKDELSEELEELANLAAATGEINLGSFHTYDNADDLM